MRAKLLFASLVGMALICLGCGRFPSRSEADKLLDSLPSQEMPETRTKLLRSLLLRISSSQSREHDQIVEHVIQRTADLYKKSPDNAILEAIDATPIDGAFANYLCDFYFRIRHEPQFLERYRSQAFRPALQRCEGSWFGGVDDLNKVLLDKPLKWETK